MSDRSPRFRDVSRRQPPRWAEGALALLLRSSDRETIPGDLAEEYQETILPARGAWRADLWYLRQVASLAWHLVARSGTRAAQDTRYGAALGLTLALTVFVINVVMPLLPAPPAALQRWLDALPYAAGWIGIGLLWGLAGFLAYRRKAALGAAARAGAIAALVSMAITMLAFVAIDNLFLDIVSRQPEKIWGFQHSHAPSMRAYVNQGLVRGFCFVLPIQTAIGGLFGLLGGAAGRLRATRR
jgi:hypothetical protein